MSNSLVLTGFGTFSGAADNPSQRVLEHLAASPHGLPGDTRLELLDVEYGKVGAWLDELLADPPKALLLTGYSASAIGLTLESRAAADCSPGHPDNAGFVPEMVTGPPLDNLHLDLPAIRTMLEREGIPAAISCDAGRFLCNFSYRRALAAIAEEALCLRALFVHLPAITGTPLADTSAAAMNLDDIARGLALVGAIMLEEAETGS